MSIKSLTHRSDMICLDAFKLVRKSNSERLMQKESEYLYSRLSLACLGFKHCVWEPEHNAENPDPMSMDCCWIFF